MRPLNFILWLATATCCWSEDNSYQISPQQSTKNPVAEIPLATDSEQVRQHVNQGIHCCLLQYPEKAQFHFTKALESDSDCILAHVGMLMVHPSGSDAYKAHLTALNKLMDTAMLTPVEEWYVSTFLQYISGDLEGAATAFRNRAERYKRDRMALYWDILLHHFCAGQGGNLVQKADDFLKSNPNDSVVHFLRALLEEYADKPSSTALQSAQIAAESHPSIPTCQLLLAHLQYRSSHTKDAFRTYQKAMQSASKDLRQVALPDAQAYRTAALAEASLYWQQGHRKESLKRCLTLCKQVAKASTRSDGDLLMQWEARTLPLRLLVLQPNAPAAAAINAAARACNAPSDSPVKLVQDCLVAAIQARALADSGRTSQAGNTLAKAERILAELQRQGRDITTPRGLEKTCFTRAYSACEGAILRARIALYTDSKDIWQPHLDEVLSRPDSRFLPPVLPRIIEE